MDTEAQITTHTFIFDGKGKARAVEEAQPPQLLSGECCFWQNLDYKDPDTYKILTENYALDPIVADALCDEETRPHFFIHNDGIAVILRGINMNKGSDPDDMISLRIWIDDKKIITLEHRNLHSVTKLIHSFANNLAPKNTMQCFLQLAAYVTNEITSFITKLSEETDDLEDDVIDMSNLSDFDLREKLSALRREIISIRRYLAPQKEIFQNLQNEKIPLITTKTKAGLREIFNDISKNIEDLDYARDHIAVYHEELQSKMSINMNRIMYMISIVTVIFLPLGLITSLLGINVAGIPYAENHYAFAGVCVFLLLLIGILIIIMRKLRWV